MGTINNDSQSCLHFVITWGALKIQGGAPPPEVWFNWSGCICGSRDVRKHPSDSWWAARLGTAVWTAACWLFSGRRSLIGNLGDTQWQAELWKLKHLRIDVFELWCWRRLLRVPWTSLTRRTWVWAIWELLKDRKPGVLQSMGLQRVDTAEQ